MSVSELPYLRVIDIGEKSLTKCQNVSFLDLPCVEECTFGNRVFSKIEEIRVDSKDNCVMIQ